MAKAAYRVPGAQSGGERRNEQLERRAIIRESSQHEGENQAAEDQRDSPGERTIAEVQCAQDHGARTLAPYSAALPRRGRGRFQPPQCFSIRGTENTALGNDGGDILGWGYIESRVFDSHAMRCHLLAAVMGHLDGGPL